MSAAETAAGLDAEHIMDELHAVIDPEVGVNIVDLGLVYGIAITDGDVDIAMTMTTPACPLGPYIVSEVEAVVWPMEGVTGVTVRVVWDPPWEPATMMTDFAKRELGWSV